MRILEKTVWLSVLILRKVRESRKKRLCETGPGVTLYPGCRIQNNQRNNRAIRIGANSKIHGSLLVLGHGGSISIGVDSFVSEATRIWSGAKISIGDRVLISHNVEIHDTNSHSLSARERHIHFLEIIESGHPKRVDNIGEAAICIEDDVWIGFNSTILKGVTIGKGAIVSACSLVIHDVEPYAIVGGSPAKVIGRALP